MSLFEAAAIHVNRAQPAVFLFLADSYEKYAPIEASYDLRNMTAIRNNPDVRRKICEAAATVAFCRKNKLPSLPTIKPAHDFHQVTIQESLRAPSTIYGKLVLRRDDPITVAIPVNEICYSLRSDVRDVAKTLYWIAWTIAYCREHKKQTKQALVFSNRSDEFVGHAHGAHVAWVFWDCVRKQAQSYARPHVEVLYKMYCLRWAPTEAKTKQHLLIAAIVIVCEGTTFDATIVTGSTVAVSNVLQGMPGWIDAIVRMQKSFAP
jgi:hypothetical protein